MSKLREKLMTESNGMKGNSDLADQLAGYFEDVTFTLESIEQMEAVPMPLKKKLAAIRKDLNKMRFQIEKEIK